jgi:hypothetical protein
MSYQVSLTDEIDLLNVSFDGQSAPDRISAKAGGKGVEKNCTLEKVWTMAFKFCLGLWFSVLRSFLCYMLYKVPQLSHLS